MSQNTKLQLQQFINQYAVCVFTKSYCDYSKMAKDAIAQNKHLFGNYEQNNHLNIIDIDLVFAGLPEDMEKLQKDLGQLTGNSTVPRVFAYVEGANNSSFIADGTEMTSLQSSKKLAGIIRKAIQQFDSLQQQQQQNLKNLEKVPKTKNYRRR